MSETDYPLEWRPVVDCPGYEFRWDNQVRSNRPRTYGGHPAGIILLKVRINRFGYIAAHLYYRDVRKIIPRTMHRIVLESYVGLKPPGFVCRHLDGNRLNNHPGNLCWGTYTENSQDRIRHGTQARGSAIRTAVLTEELVLEARRRFANGQTMTSIAREMGWAIPTTTKAINGTSWGHLPGASPSSLRRPHRTITADIVRDIRATLALGELNQKQVAERFGLSPIHIGKIARRLLWKHVS